MKIFLLADSVLFDKIQKKKTLRRFHFRLSFFEGRAHAENKKDRSNLRGLFVTISKRILNSN